MRFIPSSLRVLAAALVSAASLLSCGKPDLGATGKVHLVATIFPVYDFARSVAGDRVLVSLLLPPGVESHGYEPTPRDLATLSKAGVFVYAGIGMESWAPRLAAAADNRKLVVVDASSGIPLIAGHHHEEGELEDEGEEDQAGDPHIWLDPLLARRMVRNIEAGLTEADPAGAQVYRQNADAYVAQLEQLDADLAAALGQLKSRTIIYGGHFAFGYFAKRYDLGYVSPYAGFSPDAEPTPRRVAELAATLKKTGTDTIFYEELLEPRVATAIASETGAKLRLLHGAHNVGKDEFQGGITYLGIMRRNLEVLVEALGGSR